jgi:murein DD-endopeptidase MepM/ murein hydrolase activator NlpD
MSIKELLNHIKKYLQSVAEAGRMQLNHLRHPRTQQRIKERLLLVIKKIRVFLTKVFSKKRVVIISEGEIISVPFGPKVQACASFFIAFTVIWLSYSSGKYFAYQELISAKDRQLVHTNLTNETLQFQVSDLQKNLVRLNQYFEQVKKYDQLNPQGNNGSISMREDSSTESSNVNDELAILDEGVKGVLLDIHEKVRERIHTLESVISMTGIGMNTFFKEDPALKRSAARSAATTANVFGENAEQGGQGGPFEPISSESDDTEQPVAELLDPVLLEQSLDGNLEYLVHLEDLVHRMPFSRPMSGNYFITSGFGHRRDPIRKVYAMHEGVDFVGKYKTRVVSTAPGIITHAAPSGAYGFMVEVNHGHGIVTRYGHMSKILVKEGQKVNRGTVVGLQGSTGRSTGSHLHYEVRFNGKAIDPKKFLEAGTYVF